MEPTDQPPTDVIIKKRMINGAIKEYHYPRETAPVIEYTPEEDRALIAQWLKTNTITKLPDGVAYDIRSKDTPVKRRGPEGLTKRERQAREAAKKLEAIEDEVK
jgi:hypothetical protein